MIKNQNCNKNNNQNLLEILSKKYPRKPQDKKIQELNNVNFSEKY